MNARVAYRGLTWDHPRGYEALTAASELAASENRIAIAWDRQPLEGFESRSIAETCEAYDLVVLDHPHVGEAVARDCLQPLETLFDAAELAGWAAATAGPSFASYRYADRHWALPLDAATQVMAYRRDLVEEPPQTWDAVLALSARARVVLSLAGPHAILTFQSICGAFGAARSGDGFVDRKIARQAYAIMAALAPASDPFAALNPIAMLERTRDTGDIALIPLVYGYANYSTGGALAYADAPRGPHGAIGTTLGGTGIGISRRCQVTPALLEHLRWLMSPNAQCRFIPEHQGQPSLRAAWRDRAVDRRASGFYSATLASVEGALLRPRHDGTIAFQTEASALLRASLLLGDAADPVLDRIEQCYRRHHADGVET